MLLEEKETQKQVEQNREPTSRSTEIELTRLWQRSKELIKEKGYPFQQMSLEQGTVLCKGKNT